MALKQYRPTTPGQRQLVLIDRTGLHKGGPVKSLTEGKHSSGGRNNTGRIVVRWQGGGHKQRYRIIDFKRRKFDQPVADFGWDLRPKDRGMTFRHLASMTSGYARPERPGGPRNARRSACAHESETRHVRHQLRPGLG